MEIKVVNVDEQITPAEAITAAKLALDSAQSAQTTDETCQKNELVRQSKEDTRRSDEEKREIAENIRVKQEDARVEAEKGRVDAEKNREVQEGSPMDAPSNTGSRWARYKNSENIRNASFEANEGDPQKDSSGSQTRWQKYKDMENARNSEYTIAEQKRYEMYASEEGTLEDKEEGSRWGQYKQAEEDRNLQFADHENKHEEIFNAAEEERIQKEKDREENEIIRSSNEAARQKNETARETNENNRIAKDTDRDSNEAIRRQQESSRIAAEQARAAAETQRKQQEEQRVAEEKARVAAEKKRKEDFDKAQATQQQTFEEKEQAREDKTNATIAAVEQAAAQSDVIDMARDFGKYEALPSVALVAVESGKRINSEGAFVADSKWSIGRLGSVQVGNTYELKMGSAEKMVLGTALFVSHTTEKRGTEDVDVYTPLFSAMSTDIPQSGYVCFEAMEAYDDVLVCYRTDVEGASTLLVRRYGTKASIATQINNLKKKVDLKSFADGYYSGMRVGSADNLTSRGEATTETFISRKAGGTHSVEDGSATIKSVRGNSVKVVQIFPSLLTEYNKWYVRDASKIEVTDDMVKLTNDDGRYTYLSPNNIYLEKEHTYLFVAKLKRDDNIGKNTHAYLFGNINVYFVNTGSWQTVTKVNKTTSIYNGFVNTIDINRNFPPQIFDLTEMGMEDVETADQFAQRLGYSSIEELPFFPKTDGTIYNMTAEGIRTTDADGTTISERKWTDTIRKYFPNGMRSAGNVYDEITATKVIQRIGEVDLGSLNWWYENKNNTIQLRINNVPNIKQGYTAVCANYKFIKGKYPDKLNDLEFSNGEDGLYILIKDNRFTSSKQAKELLQGVMLYYELATPIETPIAELNLIERVWNGGTEEAIIPEGTPSAPLKADIVYPIDAYNTIKTNKEHIGDMTHLNATNKTDIVSAFNELAQRVAALETAATENVQPINEEETNETN